MSELQQMNLRKFGGKAVKRANARSKAYGSPQQVVQVIGSVRCRQKPVPLGFLLVQ